MVEALNTLDALYGVRTTLQHNNEALTARETALNERVAALEAEIAQRDANAAAADVPAAGRSPAASDPDSPPGTPPGGGGGGGDDGDGDDGDDEPLPSADDIRQLRADIERLQIELAAANAAINTYRQQAEDKRLYLANIARCGNENDKLRRYGEAIEHHSPLWHILSKLANCIDHGGPHLTEEEQLVLDRLEATLNERKFALAHAQYIPDPRALLEPLLDRWDQGEAECTSRWRGFFCPTSSSLFSRCANTNPLGGTTLRTRNQQVRAALNLLPGAVPQTQ